LLVEEDDEEGIGGTGLDEEDEILLLLLLLLLFIFEVTEAEGITDDFVFFIKFKETEGGDSNGAKDSNGKGGLLIKNDCLFPFFKKANFGFG
jgi:hypothetical protein